MTNLGTASPTCAHCGSSDKERLYLKEGHCHCCEGCLLDRCVGQKTTLDLEGLYSGFVEALGLLVGLLAVSDPIKASTPEALKMLKDAGICLVMGN